MQFLVNRIRSFKYVIRIISEIGRLWAFKLSLVAILGGLRAWVACELREPKVWKRIGRPFFELLIQFEDPFLNCYPVPSSGYLTLEIISYDLIIQEMDNHFAESNSKLLRYITCLDPRDTFASFDL
ncbi:hypothetical protein M9H77_13687 [Catharanthus roseus]|uniref:Uncharacterized protein n=1 Tax=Catharanthus roseus TaxID=4058 RepID=A0ACC0BL19_CATRO|nr:hypothetical protein M9H77_13687 [Catharanthus roseus]